MTWDKESAQRLVAEVKKLDKPTLRYDELENISVFALFRLLFKLVKRKVKTTLFR